MTIHNIPLHTYESSKDSHLSSQLKVRLNLDSAQLIVYAGRFATYQGFNLLIDSGKLVIIQSPNAFFILVGGKTQGFESLRAEVNKRLLEDSVYFAGTVNPRESSSYMEIAEILVSTRIYGPFVMLKNCSYRDAGKPIIVLICMRTPGSDHSWERVPFKAVGTHVKSNVDLGTRNAFTDVSALLAPLLEDPWSGTGKSFDQMIYQDYLTPCKGGIQLDECPAIGSILTIDPLKSHRQLQ